MDSAIATAWVQIAVGSAGISEAVSKEVGAPLADAADKAGADGGNRFGAGFKKGIAAAGIGLALIAGFKGLYDIGSTFDAINDTIRVGTGATGEALYGLQDVARDVYSSIPTSAEDAGQTIADVNTRLGLTGDVLETVASQYLEAGRILEEDVDIQGTSAAFSAFQIEGAGVSAALDTLFGVSQATGVSMNALASAAQTGAPAMRNLGFSFEETVSLAGALDKAGIDATGTFAAMQRGLVSLAQDGEEPQEAFRRITGELSALVEAGDSAAAIDLASGVFGTRQAVAFIGAVQSGTLALDDLVAGVGASGDTILGVAAETQDFAEKWQVVQNNAQAALEPLASTIFEALGNTLTDLMPMLTDFGTWLGENQWVITAFAIAIGVGLVAAFIAWTASIWAANIALLANPITWIILAIVALIAIVVALVMNWDAVVAWVSEIWNGFVSWLVEITLGLVGWWNDTWTAIGQFVQDTWDGFIGWIQDLFLGYVSWLMSIGQGILDWWNGLWSGIFNWAQATWQAHVDWVLGVFLGFLGFMEDIGQGLTDWWSGLWSGLGAFVQDAFRNVSRFVAGGLNTVIDLVNGAIRGINMLGDLANDVTGGAVTWDVGLLPKIPQLGDGGLVMPRPGGVLANLAERGKPEVVIPLDRVGDLLPQGGDPDELAAAIAARLADDEAEPVALDRTSMRELAEFIADALAPRLREQAWKGAL